LMPVGSKWQLFIPADLAYGERGQATIAPNAVLVFELEVLSIAPKAQPAPTPAPATTPAP
jgi:FKBP-type peptidyl-prolyl cis-trans isomerase FkpA